MPEVLDAEITKPAEVTGEPPSGSKETPAAEEPKVKADEPKSSESAEEKDEPKDKDNPLFQRMSKYRTQRNEAREVLTKLKDFGIESPEHAEVLQRDAETLHGIVDNISETPEKFTLDLKREFPKSYEVVVNTAIEQDFSKDPVGFEDRLYKLDPDSHSRMMSNAVRRVLLRAADESKRAGETDVADALGKVASTFEGQGPRRSKQAAEPEPNHDDTSSQQWQFFEDQVSSDVESRLTAKINDEISSRNVQFKSDAQKNKFLESVFASIDKTLTSDGVFIRERDRVQDPRLGLNKTQRKNAVDLYVKYATVNGRLGRIIADEIDTRNLPIQTKEKVERKEITGAGIAPSGTLTADDKDKIWARLEKSGLTGSDLKSKYLAELRKTRTG